MFDLDRNPAAILPIGAEPGLPILGMVTAYGRPYGLDHDDFELNRSEATHLDIEYIRSFINAVGGSLQPFATGWPMAVRHRSQTAGFTGQKRLP
jgi:hypothetical protein